MNHETVRHLIKLGELKAIINNLSKDNKIKGNCIALAKGDNLILRTNGAIIYGVYKTETNEKIMFSHNPILYKEPFVQCKSYKEMKPVILKAWNNLWSNSNASDKFDAVRYIIKNADYYRNKLNEMNGGINMNTNTNTAKVNNTKKDTNKVTAKPMDINSLNVMALAHKIRRALALEGDYAAQMKYAMQKAWAIKKGKLNFHTFISGQADVITNKEQKPAVNNNVQPKQQVEQKTIKEKDTKPVKDKENINDGRYMLKYMKSEDNKSIFGIIGSESGRVIRTFTIPTNNKGVAYMVINRGLKKFLSNLSKIDFYATKTIYDTVQVNPELKNLCMQRDIKILIESVETKSSPSEFAF